MVCIYCGDSTQVTNSRLQKRVNQVWRRRQCLTCGSNFTTHETVDFSTTISVRYSQRVQRPFERDVLFASVYESCKHREQPVRDATALTQTIISQLYDQLEGGILERNTILKVTHTTLERFDKAAATIYSAFHPASA